VLPRIDVVSRSILSGGVYDVVSRLVDSEVGYSPPETLLEILGGYTGTQWWYVGAVGITLAVVALVAAWKWPPLPFFAMLAVVSLVMVSDQVTPLHRLLYALLPRFQGLHEHSPYRVLVLTSPAVAMLAAAAIAYLPHWTRSRRVLAAIVLIPAVLALTLSQAPALDHSLLSAETVILVVTTSALVALYALAGTERVRQATLVAVLLLAVWDPAGRLLLRGFTQSHQLEMSIYDALFQESASFLHDNGAVRFLAEQQAQQPGRYAGFDPALLPDPATIDTVTPYIGYRGWISHDNRGANRLLVFNWATWFELDDVQSYNPVQIQRYAELIDAINGHRQEYHERDLFFGGLFSPLLDLLNLRYLVVPANAPERGDLARLTEVRPTLYVDKDVRVLENPGTLPRAWLVHEAQQVGPGEALAALADRAVDPRRTALLEVPPPPLEPTSDPAAETAVYLGYQPDWVRVEVQAATPALLVLSEVWDPGWRATVDGAPAPVYLADHILRAVPVPAGEHVVELTYEAPYLRLGIAVMLATAGALIAGALFFSRRSAEGGPR
jgi:hypothetical protein